MSSVVSTFKTHSPVKHLGIDCLFAVLGSMVITLCAQLSIPLWFTPVPLTMQTFAVLLVGALLGPKRGAMSVIAYLIEGASGLPVFSAGGCGLAVCFGPVGGYLLGFIASAYIAGFLLEKGWKKSYSLTLIAFMTASVTQLVIGALWLSFFVGTSHAFLLGIYPFLIVEMIKIGLAVCVITTSSKLVKQYQ